MNSEDVFIVINGQHYKLEGMPTPSYPHSEFEQLVLKRLDDIEAEQRLLNLKTDGLQTSVYWVLAAIGIFIAGITIPSVIASLVSALRRPEQKSDKVELTFAQFTDLVLHRLTHNEDVKS